MLMNILLKSILAGLLLGAALFILPFFLLRVALFALLIGALFRLVRGPRRWGYDPRGFGRRGGPGLAFADRIRQMSDEEYATFKQERWNRCGGEASGPAQGTESTNPSNA